MANINVLHVSAPGWHPQAVFQIKAIQSQHANLGTHRPHWDNENITVIQIRKIAKHKIPFFCY